MQVQEWLDAKQSSLVSSGLPSASLYGPSGLSDTATPIPFQLVLMYQ